MKTYIGIDNGVTGSIGIIHVDESPASLYPMPTFSQQNYTKTKANITRIHGKKLNQILKHYIFSPGAFVVIERPMVNPGRFKATVSAIRALEATQIVLEDLELPYQFVDSKEWQRELLPAGCEKEELKDASSDIGIRLFPHLKPEIEKQKDADAILMAEWARRKGL